MSSPPSTSGIGNDGAAEDRPTSSVAGTPLVSTMLGCGSESACLTLASRSAARCRPAAPCSGNPDDMIHAHPSAWSHAITQS